MPMRGTLEGEQFERRLVAKLNSNKRDKLWKDMGMSEMNGDLYAVHVTGKVFGKINGSLVKPKADVYIARGSLNSRDIEDSGFYIDEGRAARLGLKKQPYTGISIKMADSSRYQILKMSPNTFEKIFGSRALGAAASIYDSSQDSLQQNPEVVKGWGASPDEMDSLILRLTGENNGYSIACSRAGRVCAAKRVKKSAVEEIEKMINSSSAISDFVFRGVGNFDEPYTATWFYEKCIMRRAGPVPYSVTTGSGRHHGDFTLVIKPR